MNQPFDERAFRQALGRFTTGVTIVTATTGGDRSTWVGVTANSFTSVSLQPPMVLWSLGRNSRSFEAFADSTHFAVHVLAENQQELSNRFARTIDDKFGELVCGTGVGGVPLLPECVACFECRTAHVYEGGDHLIFVGEVLNFSHRDRAPLVFHEGRYAALEDHPELAWAGRSGRQPGDAALGEDHLHALLARASRRMAADFHRAVRGAGLEIADWHALAVLADERPRTLEELADSVVMKAGDMADLADRLLAAGLLERRGDGPDPIHRLSLTAEGRAKVAALLEQARAQEKGVLGAGDPAGQAILKESLRRIAGLDMPN